MVLEIHLNFSFSFYTGETRARGHAISEGDTEWMRGSVDAATHGPAQWAGLNTTAHVKHTAQLS